MTGAAMLVGVAEAVRPAAGQLLAEAVGPHDAGQVRLSASVRSAVVGSGSSMTSTWQKVTYRSGTYNAARPLRGSPGCCVDGVGELGGEAVQRSVPGGGEFTRSGCSGPGAGAGAVRSWRSPGGRRLVRRGRPRGANRRPGGG